MDRLTINGVEMPTVELITTMSKRGRKRTFRALLKGDRAALNAVYRNRPSTLVLARGPLSPARLPNVFEPGTEVRVRGHRYAIYRRDFRRNRVYLREVSL